MFKPSTYYMDDPLFLEQLARHHYHESITATPYLYHRGRLSFHYGDILLTLIKYDEAANNPGVTIAVTVTDHKGREYTAEVVARSNMTGILASGEDYRTLANMVLIVAQSNDMTDTYQGKPIPVTLPRVKVAKLEIRYPLDTHTVQEETMVEAYEPHEQWWFPNLFGTTEHTSRESIQRDISTNQPEVAYVISRKGKVVLKHSGTRNGIIRYYREMSLGNIPS